MKCNGCDHGNPAGAKFCNECGSPLGGAGTRSAIVANDGAVATEGGVAAGADGTAVGGDVKGDLNINSPVTHHHGEAGSSDHVLREEYLQTVIEECRPLRLKGIDQGAARPESEPPELTSVYVDLNTDQHIPEDQSLEVHLKQQTRPEQEAALRGEDGDNTRLVPVLEALGCHRRLVLLGAPGAGKSTIVQYVTLALAEARLGKIKALERLGSTWRAGAMLPVRVTLREFAEELAAGEARPRAKSVWDFINGELAQSGSGDKSGRWLRTEARDRGVLFLLDGLDETKEPAVRARVCAAVAEFMRKAGGKCRFLVTSRPYAWEEMEESQQGDETCPPVLQQEKDNFGALLGVMPAKYQVAELEPDQTTLFIERWYGDLRARGWITTDREADEQMRDLHRALLRGNYRPLVKNPLLLTLMATLRSNGKKLPDDRADLYDAVVELMLIRWNENTQADQGLRDTLEFPDFNLGNLREILEKLAFEVHGRHAGKAGAADIPQGDLVAALKPLLDGRADKAEIVVEFIERRAGLLLGQGSRARQRQFSFPHRMFQEFMAGCYLSRRPKFEEEQALLAGENIGHWREVLKLAARQATASRGVPASDRLVHGEAAPAWLTTHAATEGDWRKAVLAGEQLLEIGLRMVVSDEVHENVRKRVAGWLVALLDHGGLPARERAAAGVVLAKLGDPRKGVVPGTADELGEMEFCQVPAGDFWSGDWKPQRTKLDYGYWIAKHPVTVAQYALFLEAGGYREERYWPEAKVAGVWSDGKVTGPFEEKPTGGPWKAGESLDLANYPLVGVSWYEAAAYCRWMTEYWQDKLPGDWRIMLPSEEEWANAARGGEEVPGAVVITRLSDGLTSADWPEAQTNASPQRHYPWGGAFEADNVNCGRTGIGATSVAGCFPGGASPCGALDMAGNVWEWSRDEDVGGGKGARVLRGGAFDLDSSNVRCAFRDRNLPGYRDGGVGFRVVASPFSEL